MNPLITILLATVFGLCALLIVAGGLVHTSLRRRKAIAAGGRNMPSRILDDLQPVQDLLVDFVRHSPEMHDVLAVLVSTNEPRSFTRVVHDMRLARATSIETNSAAHLTAVGLSILFIAGLVRMKREGFIATDAGREVQLRLEKKRRAHTV